MNLLGVADDVRGVIGGMRPVLNITLPEEFTKPFPPPGLSTIPPPPGHYTNSSSIIFFTLYILIAVVGGLTNFLIIIAITSHRMLWTPTYFYMLNVSISDFLICVICCPFNAYASLYRSAPSGCAVVGVLVNVFMVSSLVSLSAVALNRYMLVKLSSEKYKTSFMCYRIIISMVIIWGVSFLCLVPLSFTDVKPGYDNHYGACISASNGSNVKYDAVQAGVFGFPSICLIYYCYVQIWRVFRSSVQALDSSGGVKKSTTKNFKLTRNLFVVTTIYTICWLPSFGLMIFDQQFHLPSVIHQSAAFLAVSHSMINPITYLVLNRSLYSAYYKLLFCCRKHTDLHCCGCMYYCLRGQAIPRPSSTNTGRGRTSTLRKISNQLLFWSQRTRSTSIRGRSPTMRDRSASTRKVSDPTPSNRLEVPTEPLRRVSEPPPARRLSIVVEVIPARQFSARARRMGTTDTTPITSLTMLADRNTTKHFLTPPLASIEQSLSDLNTDYLAPNNTALMHRGAVVSDISTSDSGCETIPLTIVHTKAVVNDVHYETEGPKRLSIEQKSPSPKDTP